MSEIQTASPLDSYMENMDELSSLMAIYSHVSNHPVIMPTGEPCQTDILLKNGIIFIVTCWDEYIKQLVTSGFDFMLAHASSPEVFPTQVQRIDG